ncbi:AI-2E family transporter [Modestobacter sp. NPDC049651]|uniref:AI-2E family transporter n=1 Tax=unclassified Modestobacter TaxID=2643866 RepID=UPI0033F5674D
MAQPTTNRARSAAHRSAAARTVPGPSRRPPPPRRPDRGTPPPPATAPAPAATGTPVPGWLAAGAAWGWRLLVVGAVGWFVVRFLSGLTVVTVPVALSILLTALLLRPTAVLRRHVPRAVAGPVVLVTLVVLVGGVGALMGWQVAGQRERLVAEAGDVLDDVGGRLAGLPGVGERSTDLVDRAGEWLQTHDDAVLSGALTAGSLAAKVFGGFVLTLFLTMFLLIDGDRVWSWFVRLLPRHTQPAANGAGHRAFQVLAGWIVGTALIGVVHAVTLGVTLWLVGTPLVLPLAVLALLGGFVPVVGEVVFGALAAAVTLASAGVGPLLVLIGVLVASNIWEPYLLQPLIMRRTVRLHPVAVLLGIAVGGTLAGVPGALIAIPLSAAVHAAVKYLTGIEDIGGNPLRDEDRMAAEAPPLTAVPPGPPARSRLRIRPRRAG